MLYSCIMRSTLQYAESVRASRDSMSTLYAILCTMHKTLQYAGVGMG